MSVLGYVGGTLSGGGKGGEQEKVLHRAQVPQKYRAERGLGSRTPPRSREPPGGLGPRRGGGCAPLLARGRPEAKG